MSSSFEILSDEELLYRKANILRMLDKINEEILIRKLNEIVNKENFDYPKYVEPPVQERKKFTFRIKKEENTDDSDIDSMEPVVNNENKVRVKFRVKKN